MNGGEKSALKYSLNSYFSKRNIEAINFFGTNKK
jgi:hypothetical protein